jgi:hypothetical protein
VLTPEGPTLPLYCYYMVLSHSATVAVLVALFGVPAFAKILTGTNGSDEITGTPRADQINGLRAHFKTPVRVSEANERGAEMKETKVGCRPLQAQIPLAAPSFEMCSKADELTRKLLEDDIRTRPSATVKDRRRFLERTAGKSLSEPTLRRLLKRMGFSRKKDSGGAGTRRVAMSRLEGDARPTE